MQPEAVRRAEHALGLEVRSWRRVVGGGYTHAEHWLLELADGRSLFAKAAVDRETADWLRTEERLYAAVGGRLAPRLVAAAERVLLLEDLTDARWPPPWDAEGIDAVLATLGEVAATPAPTGLPRLGEAIDSGWRRVADDPARFLGLGLCSSAWLEAALPVLLAGDRDAPLAGGDLLHCDVRSDNLCLRGGRALLVDWNLACVGNGIFDVAFWLPSLVLEGGPPIEAVATRHPGVDACAGFVAGFFAARAGLPELPHAPRVRRFQRAQLEVALPWAVRTLRLPYDV